MKKGPNPPASKTQKPKGREPCPKLVGSEEVVTGDLPKIPLTTSSLQGQSMF